MRNSNNELTAYIGMEINALLKEGYSSSKTKHLVTAQLVEMIMNTVAVTDGGGLDLYAVKPMLVAVKYIVDLEISKEKEQLEQQLLDKMERWEYLEELAERIRNQ